MVQLIQIPLEDFKAIIGEVFDQKFQNYYSPKLPFQEEHVNDLTARQILGGGSKPISKPTFNKLRVEGKIKTYHSSNKRVVYSRNELINFIRTEK